MPHLIHVSRFHDKTSFNVTRFGTYSPKEFFADARYDHYKQRWDFDVSKTYPHEIYSHLQTIDEEDPCYLIDLRRFVERKAQGDVIYSEKHLGYKWCWNHREAKGDWERKYSDIAHGYLILNFENHEDMVMWQLMKPSLTTREMLKFHPGYDYHNEANTSKF